MQASVPHSFTAALDRCGQMRQQRRLATAMRPDDRSRAAEPPQPIEECIDIDGPTRDIERLDAAGPGKPSRKRIRHRNSHRQVLDETSWAGGMRPSVNTCSETKSREPSKKSRTRTHQRTLTITPS
jgi:hypothetical protein